MTKIAELQKTKISSLEEGRQYIEQINDAIYVAVRAMAVAHNNEDWQFSSHQHYELKKAKQHILKQMGKIVKERHNVSRG